MAAISPLDKYFNIDQLDSYSIINAAMADYCTGASITALINEIDLGEDISYDLENNQWKIGSEIIDIDEAPCCMALRKIIFTISSCYQEVIERKIMKLAEVYILTVMPEVQKKKVKALQQEAMELECKLKETEALLKADQKNISALSSYYAINSRLSEIKKELQKDQDLQLSFLPQGQHDL